MDGFTENVNSILWVIFFLMIYFAPFLVASNNAHPQTGAIFVLNFFGGWTFIGWLVALVWACTNQGNGNNQGE